MKESVPPVRPAPDLRDQLFGRLALLNGFVDQETLDKAIEQQATDPAKALADILLQSGSLTEKARQGIAILLEEHLSRRGDDPQASISSLKSFLTQTYKPASAPETPTVAFAPAAGGPPLRLFGHYELLSEIARGGMGVVYKARQATLNRLVALKMIRSGELAGPADVRRFHAEAEAAAKLDHPGIVPVYEVGEVEGQHFFSMAFVQGQSLNERVKAKGPLSPNLAAQLLKTIAEAVQYAHDKGIVHRDVKPHNILLDENEQPRITDFGIAKHVQGASDLTAAGQVMGTPSYMPPEQALGKTNEVGPAADVYSLGATLYCLLIGRPPFQASSSAETIRQVIDDQPIPLRRLNHEIPRDLETICLKCLRKEPGKRYARAQDLADDLSRFLAGEPIDARPVGALERGAKWVQRKPATTALGAVSVLAAFAVVAAGISLAYQVRLSELNDSLGTRNTQLDDARTKTDAALGEANKQRDAANQAKKLLARHRYASDLAIAGRAWREGDVGRMLQLLNRHAPQPGEDDLRGFEWYYLRGQERHDQWRGEGGLARLSPNGKYLAIAKAGGIRLIDPATRKDVREFPGLAPSAGAFAFSRDSRRLIVPVSDKELVVWDVEQGTEAGRLKADDLNVAVVHISADGSQAATSGQGSDHTIRLWDVATGSQLKRWDVKGYAFLAAFSPDGKQLAFTAESSAIQVYDLKDYKLACTIAVMRQSIDELIYHPTGTWLIAACVDDAVLFWNASTGQPEAPPALAGGLTGAVLDISPDGKYFLTGVTRDNSVRLWDGATGRLISSRKGHAQKLAQVSLHPNGESALSQSVNGEIRLWDLRGPQEFQEDAGPFTAIRGLCFSPDVQSQALVFLDGGKIYVSNGGEHRPLSGQQNPFGQFAFSPDGKTLLAAEYSGAASFWNVATGTRLHSLQEPNGVVLEATFNQAGNLAATVSNDHTIRVWDAQTGRQRQQFPAPTTNNGLVRIYFQPGADVLVSAQSFEGLQLIPLDDPSRMQTIRDKVMTYQLLFSPNGERIVTAGLGPGNATVWSFPQLEPLLVLQGHTDAVMDFRFSPDGRRLATTSIDKTIKLWDMETGQELLTLPLDAVAYNLAFSPDGRRLAAAGNGGVIRIWDTARGYSAP